MKRMMIVSAVLAGFGLSTGQALGQKIDAEAQWIWVDKGDPAKEADSGPALFRKAFQLEAKPVSAILDIAVDDEYRLFVNEKLVGGGSSWSQGQVYDVAKHLRVGENVVSFNGINRGSAAGAIASLILTFDGLPDMKILTDGTWKVSQKGGPGWRKAGFDASGWSSVKAMGVYGQGGPWKDIKWGGKFVGVDNFTAPEGFEIKLVADHSMTGSVINMTMDTQGRPIVSREREFLYTLIDEDGDGASESAIRVTDQIKNCQGLNVIDGVIYACGEGPEGMGLYRLVDTTDDGKVDRLDLICLATGGGEHGPHGVVWGPDGALYFNIGNHSRPQVPLETNSMHQVFYESSLLPRYNDARGHAANVMAPGGQIIRMTLDGRDRRRWCAGFRNEYDIGFNRSGDLFTYDSDMEWDEGLPWYRPTRVNHCVPGGEFGWRTGSSKWPTYYVDGLPTTVDIGRGSPTGVIFYDHDQFPEKYRGALMASDWSMGRLLAVFVNRDQERGTYDGPWEEFITGKPLNVVDVTVAPNGDLYFAIGGRNTNGGVFRMYHQANQRPVIGPEVFLAGPATIDAAVKQLQPQAAWARENLRRIKKALGEEKWASGLVAAAGDTSRPTRERMQALQNLQWFGPQPSEKLLIGLTEDGNAEIRGYAVWLLATNGPVSKDSQAAMTAMLGDATSFGRRRACEAFMIADVTPAAEKILPILRDKDRWTRYAGRVLLQRVSSNFWIDAVLAEQDPAGGIYGLVAAVMMRDDAGTFVAALEKAYAMLQQTLDTETTLDLLRLIALTLHRGELGGHVMLEPVKSHFLTLLPAEDGRVNRELSILLAHLQSPEAIEKILTLLEKESAHDQQIHYAYCLRTMRKGWTAGERKRFLDWFSTTEKWTGGASFGGFLDFIWEDFLKVLTPEELGLLTEYVEEDDASKDDKPAAAASGAPAKTYDHDFDDLLNLLETDPAGKRGVAARGEKLYETAGCLKCHKFGERAPGQGVGPDLTTVANRFRRKDILEAIVYPSRVISDQYQAVGVLTHDGVYSGMVVADNEQNLTLRMAAGGKVTVPKAKIVRRTTAPSLMPTEMINALSREEIVDLFTYLETAPAAQGSGS